MFLFTRASIICATLPLWTAGQCQDPMAGSLLLQQKSNLQRATLSMERAEMSSTCYGVLEGVAAEEGTGVGGDLTNDPVLTDCKDACSGNDQCNSFAFCPEYGGCWLKDKAFTGDESTSPKGDCKTYYKKSCDATTFYPMGSDRACRGSSSSDNSAAYYNMFTVLSQEECMDKCLDNSDCKGIEFHPSGRCEVWVRPEGIQATAPVAGFVCLSYGPPASTTALVTPMPFEPVDGGSDRACRGSSASDNSAAYFNLFTGILSPEGCMAKCLSNSDCQGIEFNPSGRCEVWVRPAGIQATAPVPGFTCLSYGQSPSTTTSTSLPVTSTSLPTTSTQLPTECAEFSLWPNVDGVTCEACTALVLTSPYGGRCDRYCESFNHICVSAAEEENEDCQAKESKLCNEEIQDTSDMLCTCQQDPSLPPPTTLAPSQSSIKVVSYNLYWWNAFGQNPGNGERICDNIQNSLRPDVMGVQECDSPDLINSRTGYLRASDFAGAQGVMVSPGLFRTGETGSRDLQATGKWGPRFVTWSQLTQISSGRSFWIFNTHWCVHSGNGRTCTADTRHTGAKNMLEVIRERAGNAPVVITGDFNAAMSEAGPQHFLQNGFSLAKNNWVDSIFYSTEHWRVSNTWTGDPAGSDHPPVVAELDLV